MGQLHKFGRKKRVRETSIDDDHFHRLTLGKVRTKDSIYVDELAMLNSSRHHHPIFYNSAGEPSIGRSEGHDHAV